MALAVLAILVAGMLGFAAGVRFRKTAAAPRSAAGDGEALASGLTAREDRAVAIEYLTLYDDLTGLPNRAHFQSAVERELGAPRKEGHGVAVVLLDLDRFRETNDLLGQDVGDRLLVELAGRLERALRAAGAPVARLGGDEFACVLRVRSLVEAKNRTAELREELRGAVDLDGVPIDVEASFGIALESVAAEGAEILLRNAEAAMFRAKELRSGIEVAESRRERGGVERLALVGDLRRALAEDRMDLVYQPKLDLRSGRVRESEVLLRWTHPRHGALAPSHFIPFAERAGLIREVSAWVVDRALAQLSAWSGAGREAALAVNLSALDLHDPTLGRRLLAALARHGVGPRQLTVEITESSVMADCATARRELDRLSERGVRVSIDDFGTGYSSLVQLQRLPVDELKIDRSFVAEMTSSASARQIVRSTIDLARNLGLDVVAEGVESREALELLRDLGCDKAQGYFVSEPLPAAELDRWWREERPLAAVGTWRRAGSLAADEGIVS